MSRLHVDAENLVLLLETKRIDSKFHNVWPITQSVINIPVDHWATTFLFEYPIRLRDGWPDRCILNFKDNRTEMLKVLLYTIYDSYIAYIYRNDKGNNNKEKTKSFTPQINKLKFFIRTRIEQIENYNFTEYTEEKVIFFLEYNSNILNSLHVKLISENIVNINIDKILQHSNIHGIYKGIKMSRLINMLNSAAKIQNFEFILKLLRVQPPDYKIKKRIDQYIELNFSSILTPTIDLDAIPFGRELFNYLSEHDTDLFD